MSIYYVAPSSMGGNDSNPGTLTAPFASVAKVNSLSLNPGDTVAFMAGETFAGSLTLTHSGSALNAITTTSYVYGVGSLSSNPLSKATINVGDTSGNALANGEAGDGWFARIINVSYVVLSYLRGVGSGVDITTGASTSGGVDTVGKTGRNGTTVGVGNSLSNNLIGVGVYLYSNTSGATANTITGTLSDSAHSYTGITIDNCELTGFYEGMYIRSEPTTAGQDADGFDSVTVSNSSIHDCLHCGIYSYGGNTAHTDGTGFSFYTARVHSNLLVSNCQVYNIPGDPYNSVFTGCLMQLNNCVNSRVTGCVVHDGTQLTGANVNLPGGGGGIIFLQSDIVRIDHNEIYNIRRNAAFQIDACAMDLDEAVHYGTADYNYTHDNDGPAYQSYAANFYNTCRYNISANDARAGGPVINCANSGTTSAYYNNTVYVTPSTNPAGVITSCINPSFPENLYANNLFIVTGGAYLADLSGVGSGIYAFTNNLYYAVDGNYKFKTGGADLTTLAEIKAYAGQIEPLGTAQFAVNPLLRNIGGHAVGGAAAYAPLLGSPAIGNALDLTLPGHSGFSQNAFNNYGSSGSFSAPFPATDYAGTAMSAPHDMGAITYVPAIVTSVTVSPATATVAGGASQQLTATVYDQNGYVITGLSGGWSRTAGTGNGTINGTGLTTAGASVVGSQKTDTYTYSVSGVSGSATITTEAQEAGPVPSIASGGSLTAGVTTISLTDSDSGAAIYYTSDGSTPTTGSTLYTTPITAPSMPGPFTLKAIAHRSGDVDSAVMIATYTVTSATAAPTITVQPQAQTVTAGTPFTLTSAATGTPTPTVQWYKGSVGSGVAITGATSASITNNNPATSDAGSYYAQWTNSAGSVSTAAAIVAVNSGGGGTSGNVNYFLGEFGVTLDSGPGVAQPSTPNAITLFQGDQGKIRCRARAGGQSLDLSSFTAQAATSGTATATGTWTAATIPATQTDAIDYDLLPGDTATAGQVTLFLRIIDPNGKPLTTQAVTITVSSVTGG